MTTKIDHLDEDEPADAALAEHERPRVEEDGLDIEDDEEQRVDVVAGVELHPRRTDRLDTALVRLGLLGGGLLRARAATRRSASRRRSTPRAPRTLPMMMRSMPRHRRPSPTPAPTADAVERPERPQNGAPAEANGYRTLSYDARGGTTRADDSFGERSFGGGDWQRMLPPRPRAPAMRPSAPDGSERVHTRGHHADERLRGTRRRRR